MVEIEIKGVNRVRNDLRRLATELPVVVDKAMGEWAKQVRTDLKARKYPPPRPGQRYRRTGRLANSWKAVRKKRAQWGITNAAAKEGRVYSPFVVDKDRQAWMHKGRWWIAQDIIAKEMPLLRQMIGDDLQKNIWRITKQNGSPLSSTNRRTGTTTAQSGRCGC